MVYSCVRSSTVEQWFVVPYMRVRLPPITPKFFKKVLDNLILVYYNNLCKEVKEVIDTL